jgi:hypothetical protein
MTIYSFKVKDTFFPQTFSGEIEAESIEEAKQSILDEYATNLGTDVSELTVTIHPSQNE